MSRPKLSDGDTLRLTMNFPADQLSEINEWRFANRVPSLSEAIRRLCQMALEKGEAE